MADLIYVNEYTVLMIQKLALMLHIMHHMC